MEKERVIRGLHLLLAYLHLALATNKCPDPEVMELAEALASWRV